MDEQASDATWTRVEVLVGAPDGEVDVPVMERQGHVPNAMREIPTTYAALKYLVKQSEFRQRG